MELSQILFCVCMAVASGHKLPSSFTKCDWKQSDCLTKSVENAIHQLTSPIKDLNVIKMDPLEIPKLVIGAGSGAVAFQQNYKDMKVTGFSKISCSKVDFNSATNRLTMDCQMPSLRLDFNYEINGKILLLPIFGNGPGSIVIDEPKLKQVFDLEQIDRKGKKHFKIAKNEVTITPKKITFDLKNLFNGDRALGDNVIQVMNDSWQEVYADVESSYEEAFGKIFASVFDNVLAKVPISDLRND